MHRRCPTRQHWCTELASYYLLIIVFRIVCAKISTSEGAYNVHPHTKVCMERSKRYIYLNESGEGQIVVMRESTNQTEPYDLSCRFRIVAPRGLGVFAVIHNMTLRLDPTAGQCIDYVKFDSGEAWHVGPEAPSLCGYRGSNFPLTINRKEAFSQNTSNAIFDPSGKMDVEIHTEGRMGLQQIYLTLLFTPFIECGSWSTLSNYWEACPGLGGICISRKHFCDGMINCGAGTRTDESWCTKKKLVPTKKDSTHSTSTSEIHPTTNDPYIISPYTLTVVCFGIFTASVLLFRAICIHASRRRERQLSPDVTSIATPPLSPPENTNADCPPSYDSLFPKDSC